MRNLKDIIQIRCPLDLEGWRHRVEVRKMMGHYYARWICPVFGDSWVLTLDETWKKERDEGIRTKILYHRNETQLRDILFEVKMPPTHLGLKHGQ